MMQAAAASTPSFNWWRVVLAAAAVLMITMGMRQSLGLFVSPVNTTTGLGIVTISFALAVSQFVWGLSQPIAGAFADHYGAGRVLAVGVLLLALGSALTPFMSSGLGLVFTLGLLSAAGSGAGSFSVLIGAAIQRVPVENRGTASGVINAGGSFGQFVFAPIVQKLISGFGWMGAMWSMALLTLLALPLAGVLRRSPQPARADPTDGGLKQAVRQAAI
jgi:MFS family permease